MRRRLALLTLLSLTAGAAQPASATCTLPYTLANGQTADASQVMADLNALAGCIGTGVTGPSSATNGDLASFNGTSGAVIQDSGAAVNGGALTLGASSTQGSVVLNSGGSGTITLKPSAVAGGATTINVPATNSAATLLSTGGNTTTTSHTNVTLSATTSQQMVGLGSVFSFTPKFSTRALVTISFDTSTSATSGASLQYWLNYGTGSAPSQGTAPTGTAAVFGNPVTTATGQIMPVTLTAVITGLTPGTTYWFDLQAGTNTAASYNVFNSFLAAAEL